MGRHHRLLPHQCAVAGAGGRAPPGARALRDRRGRAFLRAPRDQGRARLRPPRRQPDRRRRLSAGDPDAGPWHRRGDRRAVARGRDAGRPVSSRGRRRSSRCGHRHAASVAGGVRRADGAPGRAARRDDDARVHRPRAQRHRLSRHAPRGTLARGRDAAREPRGTDPRGRGLHARRFRADARGIPRRGRAHRGHRRAEGRRLALHDDDTPLGEGARVPGRLHDRHGGRPRGSCARCRRTSSRR